MRCTLLPSILALLAACGPGEEDTGSDGDSAADTESDVPYDSESGGSDDSGPDARTGLSGYLGSAFADAESYAGTEEWYFVGDDATDLCRVRYDLAPTVARSDCTDCLWAFDLVASGAAVAAEAPPGCLALAGVDPSAIATIDGRTRSYGYAPEYFGHAQMLMEDPGDGAWVAVAFATWDESTDTFAYDREDGTFQYELTE